MSMDGINLTHLVRGYGAQSGMFSEEHSWKQSDVLVSEKTVSSHIANTLKRKEEGISHDVLVSCTSLTYTYVLYTFLTHAHTHIVSIHRAPIAVSCGHHPQCAFSRVHRVTPRAH